MRTVKNAFGEEVPARDKGLDRFLAFILGGAAVAAEANIYYTLAWYFGW